MTLTYTLMSDLHSDFAQPRIKSELFQNTLIVAGDTTNGLEGLRLLNRWKRKGHRVFAVTGNHEHYANISRKRSAMQTEADFYGGLRQERVEQLDRDLWVIGCNGWYPVRNVAHWQDSMNDHKWSGIPAEVVNQMAVQDADFVFDQLRRLPEGARAIVVTHTAPSEKSLDARYAGAVTNQYYVNPLMQAAMLHHRERIVVWHHGHTHQSIDVEVHGVRVLTNPRGYPQMTYRDDEGVLRVRPTENPHWQPINVEINAALKVEAVHGA